MKTTIDLPEALLAAAKKVAAREGVTLRALVVESLRGLVASRRRDGRFRLRDASFAGDGLHAGVDEGVWDRVRDLSYEGRCARRFSHRA